MDIRDDEPGEAGTSSSYPAIRPDRDLFQGRTLPFTFTVTHRERPVAPFSPAAATATTAIAPQSSTRRRTRATVQRHLTRAITLDPSTYAGYSRYSQSQFDDEAAAQEQNDVQPEEYDPGLELALDMDMERELLRGHRANNRVCGQGRRRQGPFASARRHAITRSLGAVRRVCERRDPIRYRGRRPKHAVAPTRGKLEPMVPGCTPAWKVWFALHTLPCLNFGDLDKKRNEEGRSETDNVIRFFGIVLADPTVMQSPLYQPDVRKFLIKILALGPMRWQWAANRTRQPPWALPNVGALSLSPTNKDDSDKTGHDSMETDDDTPATAVAPPKPCGPEDSAFWTWLARELARFYAPLYAERVQNSPILLQDQGGAMAFRIISDDTEGDHGHTYSGKDGNTASAIGRNLQELVEFLIKARQHEVKEEARRASEHASDPNIEPNRLPDDDVEPEAGPIDPWMSFADTCQLLISYDVGNNTANNACLGLAVDIFCMWREQGRPDQLNPLHPPWSETMHDTYQELRL